MTRRLTRDEREVWGRVRSSVRPLRPERKPSEEERAADRPPETRPKEARRAAPSPRPSPPAAPPALVGLEERARRRIARGLIPVDGRIDLHGMRQERAFAALLGFLRQSQLRGAKLVLVITGKGREDSPRGILRQTVPGWLARPDFRDLIVGFEPAARRHGGEGALYVRLRRRREARGAASER